MDREQAIALKQSTHRLHNAVDELMATGAGGVVEAADEYVAARRQHIGLVESASGDHVASEPDVADGPQVH